MSELVFLKLGGSLITDKTKRYTVRRDILLRLAAEIASALKSRPDLRLVIGHGSGSFGHVAAHESGFDPTRGHSSPASFAAVSAAATALNAIVRACLLDAKVPAVSLPPSASALVRDGALVELAVTPYERLLAWGAVPLTFGDVAVTDEDGGTIVSTEMVFHSLARSLRPSRMILLGEVEGVYSADPHATDHPAHLISEINSRTWPQIHEALGGSRGTDVTGGMRAKVAEMLALARAIEGLEIRIASGMRRGLLEQLLLDRAKSAGTVIRA